MGSRLDLSYKYLCLTQRIAKNIVCYGQMGMGAKAQLIKSLSFLEGFSSQFDRIVSIRWAYVATFLRIKKERHKDALFLIDEDLFFDLHLCSASIHNRGL